MCRQVCLLVFVLCSMCTRLFILIIFIYISVSHKVYTYVCGSQSYGGRATKFELQKFEQN